jgi:quercetin dioxygenase-like cupin family protein
MNPSLNPVSTAQGEILDLDWGRITWLVTGTMRNSENLTFGRVTIKPHAKNPVHRHPNCEELLYVVSGRIEHTLGDARYIMEAGDTIVIPAGVWHNAAALTGEGAELIICFSSADRQTESKEGEA